MSHRITSDWKAKRQRKLLIILKSGTTESARTLAAKFSVDRRTIFRDLRELEQTHGIRIQYDNGSRQVYLNQSAA